MNFNLQEYLPISGLVLGRVKLVKPRSVTMKEFIETLTNEGINYITSSRKLKLSKYAHEVRQVDVTLAVRERIIATMPSAADTLMQWMSFVIETALDERKKNEQAD
jgi:hypothetical protein